MKNKGKICSECNEPAQTRGYCKFHYNRWRKGIPLDKPRNFTHTGDITGQRFNKLTAIAPIDKRSNKSIVWRCICDCNTIVDVAVCNLKSGNTKSCGCLKKQPRGITPNPVRFEDDIAYISIFNNKGEKINEFFIDVDDYDKIKNHRWFLGADDYIVMNDKNSYYKGKKTYLHRFLVARSSAHIDHVDRNKLNNRRNNLRPATFTENFGNREKHKTYAGRPTSSKYKGVSYNKKSKCWQARIGFEGKTYTKTFGSEIEAAKQYNRWARKLFKEFAYTNEIEDRKEGV